MTKTIWKFEAPVDDEIVFHVPMGAVPLSVGVQRPRHICIWMLVVPDGPLQKMSFYVRGDGHPVDFDDSIERFVGTAFDGPFVWHVFKGMIHLELRRGDT